MVIQGEGEYSNSTLSFSAGLVCSRFEQGPEPLGQGSPPLPGHLAADKALSQLMLASVGVQPLFEAGVLGKTAECPCLA